MRREIVAYSDDVAGVELTELLEQNFDVCVNVKIHIHEDQFVEIWKNPVIHWSNIKQFIKIFSNIEKLERMHRFDDIVCPCIIGNTIKVNIINDYFRYSSYCFAP